MCGVNEYRADRKVIATQGLFRFLFYAAMADKKHFMHNFPRFSGQETRPLHLWVLYHALRYIARKASP